MNMYFVGAVLCTAGAVVCTFFASKEESKKTEKNLKTTISQQTQEIIQLNKTNEGLIKDNAQLTSEKAEEIKKLNEKNEELIRTNTKLTKEKTEEIKNLTENNEYLIKANTQLTELVHRHTKELTSEGSFPEATIVYDGNLNQAKFLVESKGEFALKNLNITYAFISDYSKVTKLEAYKYKHHDFDKDVLRKQEKIQIVADLPTKETLVMIKYATDNKYWYQEIRIIREPKIKRYLSILKDEKGKLLKGSGHNMFPTTEDNEYVLWKDVSEKKENIYPDPLN